MTNRMLNGRPIVALVQKASTFLSPSIKEGEDGVLQKIVHLPIV